MLLGMVVLALSRTQRLGLAAWGCLYGVFAAIVAASVLILILDASASTGASLRLASPLGALAGGLAARLRAPSMGVLVDGTGIELHGFWRTRRVSWTATQAIGPRPPRRRFALRRDDGQVLTGNARLPRRIPTTLAELCAAHGVALLSDGFDQPQPGAPSRKSVNP
jgi:hypothetical protein